MDPGSPNKYMDKSWHSGSGDDDEFEQVGLGQIVRKIFNNN